MPIQFLFHLCRFLCSCAWSSLFGVIMNTQGVDTWPPLNSANMLRQVVSLVTSWMRSFSTRWSNGFQILLKRGVFLRQFHFLHRARSQAFYLGPPDTMSYACFVWLTWSTDSAQSKTVFSHLRLPHVNRCMELLCSHPKPLTIWGHPVQDRRFPEHGSHLCTFNAFWFFHPWFSGSPCVRVLGLPPSRPCSSSDVWAVIRANRASKTSLFSQFGPHKGYFVLLHSLHGPRSTRFDRDPRRSTLAAIATGSWCFWSLFWNF